MACWYEIDPDTGDEIRFAGEKPDDPCKCYFDDGWVDAIRDEAWSFHEYISAFPRPSLDDLAAFVIDGDVPPSFSRFETAKIEGANEAFEAFWDGVDAEFAESFSRPATRAERYWIAKPELDRMAIGREQFYAGKQVAREEWLLYDFDLMDDTHTWARLRVFDDGTADVLTSKLAVFDDERSARTYVGEQHFADLAALRSMPEYAAKVPGTTPSETDDTAVPFRYFGEW